MSEDKTPSAAELYEQASTGIAAQGVNDLDRAIVKAAGLVDTPANRILARGVAADLYQTRTDFRDALDSPGLDAAAFDRAVASAGQVARSAAAEVGRTPARSGSRDYRYVTKEGDTKQFANQSEYVRFMANLSDADYKRHLRMLDNGR